MIDPETGSELVFYRIRDVMYETGIHVKIEVYKPIKETTCGYWVVSQHLVQSWLTTEELIKRGLAKWVHKNAARSLCYKDLKDAIYSFKRRKLSQAWRARASLQQANVVLENTNMWENVELEQLKNGVNLGRIDIMDEMCWDY